MLDIVERRNSFQDIPLKINPIVGASRWTDTYKSFSKYRNSLAIGTSYKKANIMRYRLSLDKIQNGNTGNGSVLTLLRLINATRRILDVLKLVANFAGDKTKIRSVLAFVSRLDIGISLKKVMLILEFTMFGKFAFHSYDFSNDLQLLMIHQVTQITYSSNHGGNPFLNHE